MNRSWFPILAFFLCSWALGAQTLAVRPSATVPILDSQTWFEVGGGVGLGWGAGWKGTPLRWALDLEALALPLQSEAGLVVVAAGGPLLGLEFEPNPSFCVALEGGGGWYVASLANLKAPSHNPYATGGATLKFLLAPTLGFSLGARYQYALGLYQGVSASVGFEVGERP